MFITVSISASSRMIVFRQLTKVPSSCCGVRVTRVTRLIHVRRRKSCVSGCEDDLTSGQGGAGDDDWKFHDHICSLKCRHVLRGKYEK